MFFIWNLWISRNNWIFEDKPPDIIPLWNRILDHVISFPAVCKKIRKSRNVGNAPDLPYPFGFFDGDATKKNGGASIFLLINESHFFVSKWDASIAPTPEQNCLLSGHYYILWLLLAFPHSMFMVTLLSSYELGKRYDNSLYSGSGLLVWHYHGFEHLLSLPWLPACLQGTQ